MQIPNFVVAPGGAPSTEDASAFERCHYGFGYVVGTAEEASRLFEVLVHGPLCRDYELGIYFARLAARGIRVNFGKTLQSRPDHRIV